MSRPPVLDRLAGRFPDLLPMAGFGAGKAVPGVLTLLSIPVWIGAFGVANYAIWSLYLAASLVGTSLATGWLRQAILRHSGSTDLAYERIPSRHRLALEALPLAVTAPLALLVLRLPIAALDRFLLLAVAAAGLVVTSRYLVALTLLQRDGRARTWAPAETGRTAGALGVSLVLAATGLVAPWSILAANLAATAAVLVWIRTGTAAPPPPVPAREHPTVVARYWSYGWPLSLWLALSGGAVYLDRFVLTALVGLERAGAYAAVADVVVRGMGLLVAPAVLVLHPALMRAWNTGNRSAMLRTWRRRTLQVAGVTAAVSSLAFLAYLLAAEAVLPDPLAPAPVALLLLGAAGWQLALMVHKPLEVADRSRLMLGILCLSLLVTVGLAVLLAAPLAELGVAVAFAAGSVTYVLVVAAAVARRPPADVEIPRPA